MPRPSPYPWENSPDGREVVAALRYLWKAHYKLETCLRDKRELAPIFLNGLIWVEEEPSFHRWFSALLDYLQIPWSLIIRIADE